MTVGVGIAELSGILLVKTVPKKVSIVGKQFPAKKLKSFNYPRSS